MSRGKLAGSELSKKGLQLTICYLPMILLLKRKRLQVQVLNDILTMFNISSGLKIKFCLYIKLDEIRWAAEMLGFSVGAFPIV